LNRLKCDIIIKIDNDIRELSIYSLYIMEQELRRLLKTKNYKKIIAFILDNDEKGIDIPCIVDIIDDKFHEMYLIERNRRNDIKKIENDKHQLLDKAKNLLVSKEEWKTKANNKITKILEDRYDVLIKEYQINEYLKNKMSLNNEI